jgi:uncharacterized protein YggU (UPF0235/DUF167 family)
MGYTLSMYIKVKVTPDAKEDRVEKVANDLFHIAVRAPAEMNQANKRVVELLRAAIPGAKEIRLVSGHQSPSKIFGVELE